MSHVYTYELFQPLVVICMRSKSETIRALAFESVHILTYLLGGQRRQFANLCIHQIEAEVPRQLFELMFEHLEDDSNLQLADESDEQAAMSVQNTKFRALHQLIGCYTVPVQLEILGQ